MVNFVKEIKTTLLTHDVSCEFSRDNIRFAAVSVNCLIVAILLFIPLISNLLINSYFGIVLDLLAIMLFSFLSVFTWRKKTDLFVYIAIFVTAVLFGIFFITKYDGSAYFWTLTFPVFVFLGVSSIVRVYIAIGYFLLLLFLQIMVEILNIDGLGYYGLIPLVRFYTAYFAITFIMIVVFWVRELTLDQVEKYHDDQDSRIKELEVARAELRSLVNIDPLTRIHNKRYLYSEENTFFEKSDKSYTIAFFIDIDDFKKYNDSHGHIEGDNALYRVASILKSCLYEAEHVIFRFGGEEFLCFVNTDNLSEGKAYSESILGELRNYKIKHKYSKCGYLSVSIGISFASIDSELDLSDLISRSDNAMYKAKVTKNSWYQG